MARSRGNKKDVLIHNSRRRSCKGLRHLSGVWFWSPETDGLEGLKELRHLRGPTLVMPNHPGLIDPVLVLSHVYIRGGLRPIVTRNIYRRVFIPLAIRRPLAHALWTNTRAAKAAGEPSARNQTLRRTRRRQGTRRFRDARYPRQTENRRGGQKGAGEESKEQLRDSCRLLGLLQRPDPPFDVCTPRPPFGFHAGVGFQHSHPITAILLTLNQPFLCGGDRSN